MVVVASALLTGLVRKLSHNIPDIRDRAMKALSLKLLSPLCDERMYDELSLVPGLAHSYLQWLNDRYDSAALEIVKDCLDVMSRLISKSEGMRCLFIDAGGPSFLDDFGNHNPGYSEQCKDLVSMLLCLTEDPPIASSSSSECAPIRQDAVVSLMNPFDEAKVFDLAVRIKFATCKSSENVVRDLAYEIRFGFGMSLDPETFLSKPYLLEALLGQLNCTGPSSNPVSDFTHFAEAIEHIVQRVCRLDIMQRVYPIMERLVFAALESLLARPDQFMLGQRILIQGLRQQGGGFECDLERLVFLLSRVTESVFPNEIYREEQFTFADGSQTCLRKVTDWDPFHRVVAEMIIETVCAVSLPDNSSFFLNCSVLTNISDWISDEGFYTCERSRMMASKAAVSVATLRPDLNQTDFIKAREMTICLKKIQESNCQSESDISLLFPLWLKAPELFPNQGDPIDFIQRTFSLRHRGIVSMVTRSEILGDALVSFLGTLERRCIDEAEKRIATELLAFTRCSSPAMLVSLMEEKFGLSLPLLSSIETIADASIDGLARSLFSHRESIRKQASLVLWKSSSRGGVFVPDPWRSCGTEAFKKLEHYVLGSMSVDWSEIEHAIQLALNEHLGAELRTASTVQACTLISSTRVRIESSSCLTIEQMLQSLGKVFCDGEGDLFVALCHLATLLLDMGSVACHGQLDISILIPAIYDKDEDVMGATMLLLSRLLFNKDSLAFTSLLRRIDQVSYHLMRSDLESLSDVGTSDTDPRASLKSVAICVSLLDVCRRCDEEDMLSVEEEKSLVVALHTPPLLAEAVLAKNPLSLAGYIRNVVFPLKHHSRIVRDHFEEVLHAFSGMIDSGPIWASVYPDFACECFDLISVAVLKQQNRENVVRLGGTLVPAVVGLLKRSSQEWIINSGLKLLLVLSSLGFDMRECSQLTPLVKTLIEADLADSFAAQAGLWLTGQFSLVGDLLSRSRSPLTQALLLRVVSPNNWSVSQLMDILQTSENELVLNEAASLLCQKKPALKLTDFSWFSPTCSTGGLVARLKVASCCLGDDQMMELAHRMIQSNEWSSLFERCRLNPTAAAAVVGFAACCLDLDKKLFAYLSHAGLLYCLGSLSAADVDEDSLVSLLNLIRNLLDGEGLNHYQPALDWMQSAHCWSLLANCIHCYSLIEVVASILTDQGLAVSSCCIGRREMMQSIERHHLELINSPRGCCMLSVLFRVPGLVQVDDAGIAREFFHLMKVHESVSICGDEVLLFGQIRLISSWAAATGLRDAYSDWFCLLWKKALLIVPSKHVSFVPILTELVCGFLEVIISSSGTFVATGLNWAGPGLSHILSFATRTEGVPNVLLSLCLSVAESASAILVNKAVTGRLVSALVGMHACNIHAKHIPKDSVKSGMVIRFCSSLAGCRQMSSEVLKHIDGWVEAQSVFDPAVLVRAVASIVLSGGHNRTAVASSSDGLVAFLQEEATKIDDVDQVARQTLALLEATHSKYMGN